MGKASDFYFNDVPICPYCEDVIDFFPNKPGKGVEIVCNECGKKFLCDVHAEYTFSTRRNDNT